MPELLRDEPNWWFFDTHGRPVTRPLRVWRTGPGRVVAVITERGPGMSITNAAERAVEQLRAEHLDAVATVIEHYPPECGEDETFDEIQLGPGGLPSWRRLTVAEMTDWLGPEVLDQTSPPSRAEDEPPRPPPVGEPPLVGPGLDHDIVFHGHPTDGPGEALVTVETPTGLLLGPLRHIAKHSGGFSWGYSGSGPADLARCLLIATLGSDVLCATCGGTTAIGYNTETHRDEPYDPARHDPDTAGRCMACDNGIALAPALYQQFKDEVVSRWPMHTEWRITAGEINAWVRSQGADRA